MIGIKNFILVITNCFFLKLKYKLNMKFHIFLILIFSFFLITCANSNTTDKKTVVEFENIYFDAVTKNLDLTGDMPINFQKDIERLFNNFVKINGVDGDLVFKISNFQEVISNIDDGKRVDTSVDFKVEIKNSNMSKSTYINGSVVTFGTITGEFSLSEFDQIRKNTQENLLVRLNQKLKK